MRDPKQNTQNDFLPADYIAPSGSSNYLKLAKGENRFRILSKPILGYLDWTADKKPLRFTMDSKPAPIDPTRPVKHFWAFIVWDVNAKAIKIMEVTQSTIQKAIKELTMEADYGSPYLYDIKIVRDGDGMDTEYSVMPLPPKPVTKEMIEAFDAKKIYLPALYQGLDPMSNHGEFTPKNDLIL